MADKVKNANYYRVLWAAYPDVLTTAEFVEMLGISDWFARQVIREKRIQYFRLGSQKIRILKESAITFVLGDFYRTRKNLKARI